MLENRLPDRLFHFTCVDGVAAVAADGWWLRPNLHPVLGRGVVWLTDFEYPDRAALGLISSDRVPCDRTEFRLEIVPQVLAACVWWPVYARTLPRHVRQTFEYGSRTDPTGNPGLPVHWWVAMVPVPVLPQAVYGHTGQPVAVVPQVQPQRRRKGKHR